MTVEQRKEFVINWLKQERVYDKYYDYFTLCCIKNNHSKDELWDQICKSQPYIVFASAFTWGDTEEGHDYWQDLANKFSDLFKK